MTRWLLVAAAACGTPRPATLDAPGAAPDATDAGDPSACGGQLAWVRSVGNGGWDVANGVIATSDGGAVVTGYFQYGVVFGQNEVSETTLVANGKYDIYVARYHADGSLAWVTQAGGAGDFDLGVDTAPGPDGATFVTGTFEDDARWGAGEPGQTVLASAGLGDVFVARYHDNGALAWVRQAGGTGSDEAYSVVTSGGLVYVAGRFQRDAVFGTAMLHSAGGDDAFVAAYDEAGVPRWARAIGGSGDERAYASAGPGGVFVTGHFSGTIHLDGTTTLATGGPGDISTFVASYTPDGTLAWARQVGGSQLAVPGRLVATNDGGVVLVGSYQDTITLGAGEPGQTVLTADTGQEPLFVARFAPDGQLAWAHRLAAGTTSITGTGIAETHDGALIVSGEVAGFPLEGPAMFGSAGACAPPLMPTGDADLFVAELTAAGDVVWLRRAGALFPEAVRGARLATLDDHIYLGGIFSGTATFGPSEPNQTALVSHGSVDLYLARLQRSSTH